MVSLCNVQFLHYKPNFAQKMIGHSFCIVSVPVHQVMLPEGYQYIMFVYNISCVV